MHGADCAADGGLAFTDPALSETRFSHRPNVVGGAARHLDDKVSAQLESPAVPPAIGVRSVHGTTRTGARGQRRGFYDTEVRDDAPPPAAAPFAWVRHADS
jgi:hypothetical protein